MAAYLVDTNILVLALRRKLGKWELLKGLVAAGATLGCSAITIGEVYAGMRPHERAATEALLAELDCYDVTMELARSAGLLRNEWKSKGQTLALDDTLIAATAMAHRLMLLTDNRKDFPMPELTLYPLP
jgi:hypothetical protein